MKHRGEVVENAIRLSKVPISEIARQIDYTRVHMYNFFDDPTLSLDIIVKIGKAINYDFRKEFPELFIQEPENMVHEPLEKYSTLADCLKEKNEYRQKYYDLLEEHNTLLKQKIDNK